MLTLDKVRELQERHSYDENVGRLSGIGANASGDGDAVKAATLEDAAKECAEFLSANIAHNSTSMENPAGDTLRTKSFDIGRSNKKYRMALHISYEEQESGDTDDYMSFAYTLEKCQDHIAKSFRERRDERDKLERTKAYISDFVYKSKLGSVRKPGGGRYTLAGLVSDLTNEITNYGPITQYVKDDTIDEVRANGPKEVFLESGGKTLRCDATFVNAEHMERIISKLIGVSKVRLTPKSPMVNARTIEGYRVNATYAGISPYNQPAFVLRKFSKREIKPEDMVRTRSFSKNMYALLSLIPKADLSWMTVGPTGSGKTTLNELLVREIDPMSRVITIENPSEMRLQRRNEHGVVVNDILQYECIPDDEGTASADPTMENLLINAMRQSPHWIGPGELRTPGEFATALRAAQTGHFFFTTLHAEGGEDAIIRFLTSYLIASSEPAELALRNICAAVKFVIYQEKLADGSRKITSISEIIGSEGLRPVINHIYRFEIDDVVEEPGTRRVLEIIGRHKRVGVLSAEIQQKMLKAGIRRERFEFLTRPPGAGETEEYE